MADDLVAVAPTAARALAHLGGHPRGHRVEEPPARAQQLDLAVDLGVVHRFVLERRWREGDAPEVGRAGADPVLDDLEGSGGVELLAIRAATAIGRYRSRYDSSSSSASSGVFAPRLQPGQSTANATAFFPLGPRSRTVRTGIRRIVRADSPVQWTARRAQAGAGRQAPHDSGPFCL